MPSLLNSLQSFVVVFAAVLCLDVGLGYMRTQQL